MSAKTYDVVTVGLQCIDLVTYPVREDVMRREVTTVKQAELMLGGDALNQAITLSKLGARVALMGAVGRDGLGDVLLNRLENYPITVLDERLDVGTTISQVLIDESGERHFVYQPQSNDALKWEHLKQDALQDAAFVSIGGCCALPGLDGEGMIRTLDCARKAGARTAVDFRISAGRPAEDVLRAVLSRSDYVLPSEQEAEALTGEGRDPRIMVECLRDLGARNCVIKLGARGCYVAADGVAAMIGPFPCRCVDTTGAGDTFVGAFLYGMTRGWDVETCARFANAAGSLAVESFGANTAIRSREQVLQRMGAAS